MHRTIITASLALALAACGTGEDSAATAEAAGAEGGVAYNVGEGGEVNIASGAQVTAELPEGFDVYPGASVVTATNITSPDGGGAVVVMNASASPQDLVDYYRAQAEAAGVSIATEASAGGNLIVAGEGPNGLTFSFNASDNGGTTTAQLVVGRGVQ